MITFRQLGQIVLSVPVSGTFPISECAGIRFQDTGQTFFVIDLANPDTIVNYELYLEWDISATIAKPIKKDNKNMILMQGSGELNKNFGKRPIWILQGEIIVFSCASFRTS